MKKFGSAVILAGGLSSRMGFDKQFMEIGDTVLSRFLASVLSEEFEDVIIVTNRPECYENAGPRIVSDIIPGKGPLSGIHSGLTHSSSEYAYFLACDMPNLSLPYVRYLKSRMTSGSYEACVARAGDWIEPFHSFFSRDAIGRIERYLEMDRRSVYHLLGALDTLYLKEEEIAEFNPGGRLFANLNTRQELEAFVAELPEGILSHAGIGGHPGRELFAACG